MNLLKSKVNYSFPTFHDLQNCKNHLNHDENLKKITSLNLYIH